MGGQNESETGSIYGCARLDINGRDRSEGSEKDARAQLELCLAVEKTPAPCQSIDLCTYHDFINIIHGPFSRLAFSQQPLECCV